MSAAPIFLVLMAWYRFFGSSLINSLALTCVRGLVLIGNVDEEKDCAKPVKQGDPKGAWGVVDSNRLHSAYVHHPSSPDDEHSVNHTESGSQENEAGSDIESGRPSLARIQLREKRMFVEKKRTLLSLFVWNERLLDSIVYFYDLKATRVSLVLFWVLMTVLSVFVSYNMSFIPSFYILVLQVAYSTHFLTFQFAFINADVAKEIAKSFNFWYTACMGISTCVGNFFLFGYNVDMICTAIHLSASLFALIFLDANAKKAIVEIKILCVLAILWSSIHFVTLVFYLHDFKVEKIYYGSSDIEIMDTRLQSLDSTTSLSFYIFRILFIHFVLKRKTTIAFLSNYFHVVGGLPRSHLSKESQSDPVTDVRSSKMHSIVPDQQGPSTRRKSATITPIASDDSLAAPNTCSVPPRNQPGEVDERRFLLFGILQSKLIQFDPHQTVYHKFLEKKSPNITRILQSSTFNALTLVVCAFSVALSVMLSTRTQLPRFIYFISTPFVLLSIFFCILQITITCNFFLLKMMLKSFDYWYLLYLMLKAFLSAGMLCAWDSRTIFWFYIIILSYWSIMIDAYHVKYRRLSVISVPVALTVFLLAIMCKLNFGETFERDEYMEVRGIQLMSSKTTLSTCLFNIGLFLMRFYWTYHSDSTRMFFITENISVEDNT